MLLVKTLTSALASSSAQRVRPKAELRGRTRKSGSILLGTQDIVLTLVLRFVDTEHQLVEF